MKDIKKAGTKNHRFGESNEKTDSKTHREALDKLLEGSVNEKLTLMKEKYYLDQAESERENIKSKW